MHKIHVQRKIEVWIEDIYHVKDLSEETLEKAINYDLDYDLDYEDSETLWETQVDLGPIEIYDENWNLIRKND